MQGDSDEEQWEEETLLEESCECLFCDVVCSSCTHLLQHCTNEHGLNLEEYRRGLGLDFYGWVKLITYVRKEHPAVKDLILLTTPPFPWEDERFLVPEVPNDPLLQLDIDEDSGSSCHDASLAQRLKQREQQLEECKAALSCALDDLQQMRDAMRDIIGSEQELVQQPQNIDACLNVKHESDSYFESYSWVGIHQEMLKDDVRMEAYQLFIAKNKDLFKDKVVLDVGCGTGILSLFAVQSGASHVIAVDQASMIYKAMDIARENDLHKRITFIKGCVEEVELPVDKVDVIISEWMGYFLLFESMLDTVLFARDKWLKCKTQVFPNHCSLNLAALGDQYEYDSRFTFWGNVCGIKMSCMKQEMFQEACVMNVDQYSLISSTDVIKRFDLAKMEADETNFDAKFSLTMQHNTVCHGLVGFFDVNFDVPNYKVFFSTSPQDPPTHWKHTVFFFKEPVSVHTGDLLKGVLSCRKHEDSHRCLQVKVSAEILAFSSTEQPCKLNQTFIIS